MIAKLLLPGGLAFIMFALGLTLRFSDFGSVFVRPGKLALGLFWQLVVLPLFAFTLMLVWPVGGALALGVMILAACPGGITSNLLTHFARGDTALSISMTAIASLAGMITVPLVVTLSGRFFSTGEITGNLSVVPMALAVFSISTLPVIVGMTINLKWTELAEKISRIARPLSVGIFVLIVIGAFAAQWDAMMENLPVIGLPIAVLNVSVMISGYWVAMGGRAGRPAARAISLEAGLQNGAMGIFVAVSLLGNATAAIPSITYALVMNVSAAAMILFVLLRGNRG